MFGKQSKVGPAERVDEYSYIGKNGDQYTLTENIVTGDAQIVKDKMGVGSSGDKTFYTINEKIDDNAFRDPINVKDNSNSYLTDLTDDSLNVDSINQSKKDYSKKIQFVND